MRDLLRFSPLLLLLFGLSACADRLSEDECVVGDWTSIGYRDGVNGQSAAKVQDRLTQCARFDIQLDATPYEMGRVEGLKVFCSPQGAHDAGLRSVGDIDLCIGAPLLTRRAYYTAQEFSRARSEFRNAENSYLNIIRYIDDLEYETRRLSRRVRKEKNDEKRNELRTKLIKKERRLREYYDDVYGARYRVQRADSRYRRAQFEYDDLLEDLRNFERENRFGTIADIVDRRPENVTPNVGNPSSVEGVQGELAIE